MCYMYIKVGDEVDHDHTAVEYPASSESVCGYAMVNLEYGKMRFDHKRRKPAPVLAQQIVLLRRLFDHF